MRINYGDYQLDIKIVNSKICYGYARHKNNFGRPFLFFASSEERCILKICTAIDRGDI